VRLELLGRISPAAQFGITSTSPRAELERHPAGMALQTLPDERDADDAPAVGNVAGFSLHGGVAAKANQRY